MLKFALCSTLPPHCRTGTFSTQASIFVTLEWHCEVTQVQMLKGKKTLLKAILFLPHTSHLTAKFESRADINCSKGYAQKFCNRNKLEMLSSMIFSFGRHPNCAARGDSTTGKLRVSLFSLSSAFSWIFLQKSDLMLQLILTCEKIPKVLFLVRCKPPTPVSAASYSQPWFKKPYKFRLYRD